MKLLNFTLPDFVRLGWVSDSARDIWEPRLKSITNAWMQIEWLSVVTDIRSCCIVMVLPEDFVKQGVTWLEHGLSLLPLEVQKPANHVLSMSEENLFFRVALGKSQELLKFKHAIEINDDKQLGKMLGTPSCCLEFFRKVWIEKGITDTTWPMVVATSSKISEETRIIEVPNSPENNILWRWIGIRAIPHLSCSFHCKQSIELSKQFIKIGYHFGYMEEMNWLREILSWPVEWSALHGVAEIKTPILRFSTQTDATALKYEVKYMGNSYPSEGAYGLNFPYVKKSQQHCEKIQNIQG